MRLKLPISTFKAVFHLIRNGSLCKEGNWLFVLHVNLELLQQYRWRDQVFDIADLQITMRFAHRHKPNSLTHARCERGRIGEFLFAFVH
ncbi:hypothetical protein RV134_210145 [Roseovarius sp. EC-HK134]|nr:hypothetical protein RV134_210145 [Roseovarius sp. EC-HK134]VVT01504.1 hypothetical protein RV420_260010 [Roseovarius sp. EC-SD190]